jgi:hypothetical protein
MLVGCSVNDPGDGYPAGWVAWEHAARRLRTRKRAITFLVIIFFLSFPNFNDLPTEQVPIQMNIELIR